jgi:RecQ-mediated genome instability protein 1
MCVHILHLDNNVTGLLFARDMSAQRQHTGPAMAGADANEIAAQISAHLTAKNVPPTQAWMHAFKPSIKLNMPVEGQKRTALFRILAADLTTAVQRSPTSGFPPDLANPDVKERTVRGPVTVQILDVEDIGRSRWSQVEAIEAQERGETSRGREVIRVVPDEENLSTALQRTQNSSGPHKLLLQDVNGAKIYAIELKPVPNVNVQMSIGAKMVLKNFVVARGVILLDDPRNVDWLGGKVDAWDKKWKDERKQVLKEKAGMREGGT